MLRSLQDVRLIAQHPKVCAFATGSTNRFTGKPEPPILCQQKGCTGIFIGRDPLCDTFYPVPSKPSA